MLTTRDAACEPTAGLVDVGALQELLIRKLDERKKGKSCPGNLPAARVKQ
jgi:hypothetical protein